jgi:hypothetical protein
MDIIGKILIKVPERRMPLEKIAAHPFVTEKIV